LIFMVNVGKYTIHGVFGLSGCRYICVQFLGKRAVLEV